MTEGTALNCSSRHMTVIRTGECQAANQWFIVVHTGIRQSNLHEVQFDGVIVKSGVSTPDSSGDPVNFYHLDSIFTFDSRNHLRQVVKPAQAAPFFLGAHTRFEHHVQHAISGKAAL